MNCRQKRTMFAVRGLITVCHTTRILMSAFCGCYVNIFKYHHKVIQCGVVYKLECFLMAGPQCHCPETACPTKSPSCCFFCSNWDWLRDGNVDGDKWRHPVNNGQRWFCCNSRHAITAISVLQWVSMLNKQAAAKLKTIFQQHRMVQEKKRPAFYGCAYIWVVC